MKSMTTRETCVLGAAALASLGLGILVSTAFLRPATDPRSNRHTAGVVEGAGTLTEGDRIIDDATSGLFEQIRENGDIYEALSGLLELGKHDRIATMIESIRKMDAEHLGRLAQFVFSPRGPDSAIDERGEEIVGIVHNQHVLAALFENWIAADPDAVFRAAEEHDALAEDIYEFVAASAIFSDGLDSERLLTRLREDADESEFDYEIGELEILRRFRKAPGETVAWIRENEPDFRSWDTLFRVGGIGDPWRMVSELVRLEDEDSRKEAMRNLFGKWMQLDPEAALKGVDRIEDVETRSELQKRIIPELVRRNPEVGMRESVDAGQTLDGLTAWLRVDAEAALEWAEENLDEQSSREFLKESIEILPLESTLAFLERMPRDSLADVLRNNHGHFISRFGNTDIREAIAWFQDGRQNLDDVGWRSGMILGERLAAEDLGEAWKMAQTMSRSRFQKSFVSAVARASAAEDPEAAQAWLATLEGETAERATKALHIGWARRDGEAAYESAVGMGNISIAAEVIEQWADYEDAEHIFAWSDDVLQEPGAEAALKRVVGLWTAQDPWAAGETILALEKPQFRDSSVGHLIDQWAREEPVQAGRFIDEQMEPGTLRDTAVGTFVQLIADKDPASAMEWAKTITNSESRQFMVELVANRSRP